jgi:hypothetical protein
MESITRIKSKIPKSSRSCFMDILKEKYRLSKTYAIIIPKADIENKKVW